MKADKIRKSPGRVRSKAPSRTESPTDTPRAEQASAGRIAAREKRRSPGGAAGGAMADGSSKAPTAVEAAPASGVVSDPARPGRPRRSEKAAASVPARRPRARGEAARQEKLAAILGAALEVFAEKGYADTRLEDVARKAGVAKG